MRTIYKYVLQVTDLQNVEMPKGAQILCVQVQYGFPCIWALVDPDKPTETRSVITIGTGHNFNQEDYAYVGTYQLQEGKLVFHVYAS